MTKSCLCLTWKPLKISSWNFIQILRIIRRRAEHKNHNSCLYSFEVILLYTFVNSSYIFLTPLEIQVQHFMYFTCLCTLLNFWVYTPLLYQNLTFCTKLHHSNRGETSVFKTNPSFIKCSQLGLVLFVYTFSIVCWTNSNCLLQRGQGGRY